MPAHFLATLFEISWSWSSIEWRLFFLQYINIYWLLTCVTPTYHSLFYFIVTSRIFLSWFYCFVLRSFLFLIRWFNLATLLKHVKQEQWITISICSDFRVRYSYSKVSWNFKLYPISKYYINHTFIMHLQHYLFIFVNLFLVNSNESVHPNSNV